ncbi:hypothetical protein [Phycicoccus sp. DTK01]|uniref:hypothetical protein n=1 Tax=Phycicoccus sp. DTK01 TaxID=2785745 RepID=UPI001A900DF5|nr:hypothetical protein [Phycicoccus sp. DTK01]GIL35773.1 hypothetical protein PDTK01_18480 [Phycicoccus sp. DTK01]
MPENGELRRNPVTGEREIYFEPPGEWEPLGADVAPDHRVPDEDLGTAAEAPEDEGVGA